MKFLRSIKDLVLRHKLLTIICFLALVIVVFLVVVFFDMFIGGSNEYGNRLKGIDDVVISNKLKKDVVSFLEEKEEYVDSATIRVQGKIIYINIIFTRKASLDKAKAIATETLAKFDEDEKEYYDFGYFLTQIEVENKDDKGYVVTGSKNAKLDSISWIKS